MLLYTVVFLLLSNAVVTRRDKSILYSRVAISILVCLIILCISMINLHFIDNGIGLYGGLFHMTSISITFHTFVFILTAIILQLNGFYPRKALIDSFSSIKKLIGYRFKYFNLFILNKMAAQFKILEYPLIIIFVIVGAVFLISSYDLVSLFLSIELQSYGLYILCTIYRNSERSISGGLTYFLLGGLSSSFILLASSLLYGNSGNTNFDGLYVVNNVSAIFEYSKISILNWYDSYYLGFSLIVMSVGFLFKISAAPFHFWSPDVYDAIPTIVTTFVAILAKISIFIFLLELVYFTRNIFFSANFSWTISLLMSSLLSLLIGSLLGLVQFRIKRLYAYSTISHLGFLLLALTINTVESVGSFVFYLIQYSISNLNAFLLLIVLGISLYCYIEKKEKQENMQNQKELSQENEVSLKSDLSYLERQSENTDSNLQAYKSKNKINLVDIANSPIQLVSQLKGYFHINSFLALSLAVTLFSFVGIPPLIGFFAKQAILSSAIDNGYVFMAFIAILTSVISAYYYLTVVKQMFFHKTNYTLNPFLENVNIKCIVKNRNGGLLNKVAITIKDISISGNLSVTVSILTLLILVFILIPNEWLNMANILALLVINL